MSVQGELSDGWLVELARAGEAGAFDVLVHRFQRAVYATAFAAVTDCEAAQDVLQESWTAAYRQLRKLDDPGKFGPWVCGIARNQARQYLRSQGRRAARELPLAEMDEVPVPATDDSLWQIREALALLTAPQAELITLFYMEGYSIRECAGVLGGAGRHGETAAPRRTTAA